MTRHVRAHQQDVTGRGQEYDHLILGQVDIFGRHRVIVGAILLSTSAVSAIALHHRQPGQDIARRVPEKIFCPLDLDDEIDLLRVGEDIEVHPAVVGQQPA